MGWFYSYQTQRPASACTHKTTRHWQGLSGARVLISAVSGVGQKVKREGGKEGVMLFCTKWNEAVKDTEEGFLWHAFKCNSSIPQFVLPSIPPSLPHLHTTQVGSVSPWGNSLWPSPWSLLMWGNSISCPMRCTHCLFRKQIHPDLGQIVIVVCLICWLHQMGGVYSYRAFPMRATCNTSWND